MISENPPAKNNFGGLSGVWVLLPLLMLGLVWPSGPARSAAGANSAEVLRMTSSARPQGMGNAFTANADGSLTMQYNPGGFGFTEAGEVEFTYQKLVEDIGQGNMAFAHPFGEMFTWGADLKYVDYGQTTRTTISTSGGSVSGIEQGTFSGMDMVGGLGLGVRRGNWGFGVIGRYLRLEIDNVGATGMAFDAGLQWRHPYYDLSFGLALQNLGTGVQFDEVQEDLPTAGRVGVSVRIIDRVRINLDVETVRRGDVHFMGGAEWRLKSLGDFMSLRAGYDGRSDIDSGLTLGMGFVTSGIKVDYAFVPFSDFGDNHRISIRW